MPTTGARIRTKRNSVVDRNFMITPNALLRGEGAYSALSSYARLYLAAGLSWGDRAVTLDEMKGWIPELGRTRHEALRRELREHGFLSLYRAVVPAGEPNAGSFVWIFEFLMDPLPEAERDRLQERKPRPEPAVRKPPPPRVGAKGATAPKSVRKGETAGHTMPPNPEPLTGGEETAGHTTLRNPGPGGPGPGVRRDVYKDERTVVKEPPSPPIADGAGPTSDPAPETAAAADPKLEEQVTDCVEQVAAVRPEWSRRRVAGAVRQALADGRDPTIVLAAVRLVAADPATRVPGRLNEEGEWWARAARAVHGCVGVSAPPLVRCDRCGLKSPEGVDCPRCTEEGPFVAPGASQSAAGASEITARGWAMVPPGVRERLAGGARS